MHTISQVHLFSVQSFFGSFGQLLGQLLRQLNALMLSFVVARLLSFGERLGVVFVQYRNVLEMRQIVAQRIDGQQIVVVHVALLFLLGQPHKVVLLIVLLGQILFDRLASAHGQLVHLLRRRIFVVLIAELFDQSRRGRTLLGLLQLLFLLRSSFVLLILVLDWIDLGHNVGGRLNFRLFVFAGLLALIRVGVFFIIWSGKKKKRLVWLV